VVLAPYLSVSAAMWEIGGLRRGLPSEVLRTAAGGLTGPAWRVLRSVCAPNGSMYPDCLHPPMNAGADRDVASSIESLRAVPGEQLVDEIGVEFPGYVPEAWREPLADPRSWLASYADAAESVHQRLDPLLARAGKLVDREVERVGTAVVRGLSDVLLASLNQRIGFRDGLLTYDHPTPGSYDLAGRRLVLMPMLAGPRFLLTNFDQSGWVCIAYPVPGIATVASPPGSASRDGLSELLGAGRAGVLRLLDTRRTMGELAAALQLSPSTVTGHCQRLEGLDLVQRERRGREIRVTRTARGVELIDLMRR
jgi:DNA-binding transcriptional ArsR family regulator